MDIGQTVALYGGEGGRGVVIRTSEMGDTRLVRFTDGSKVWCFVKNLTPQATT